MPRAVTRELPSGSSSAGEVPLRRLPGLHAARIHHLDRVPTRGAEQPGGVVAGAVALAGVDQPEQVVVVAHEHEAAGVDAGRVAHLVMRVPRRERCNGGIEDGGVAQAGVAIAGGEGARHGAAGARASGVTTRQARRGHRIGGVLLRQETARVVAARARDVAVDVHATGHDDHAAHVERRRAGGQVGHDPAVGDADVAHLAVDAVRRVVDRASDDAERRSRRHAATSRRLRDTASSSAPSTIAAVRGPSSAGASGSGMSSRR